MSEASWISGEVSLHIQDWHRPLEEACVHNIDASWPCTCKRLVNRKNYRVCRVHARDVDHGVNPRIVVEVHTDGGLLRFRELGRRKFYDTDVARIYRGLVWREAMSKALEAKKARAAARKARRGK